jgi:hypothetical protein
MSYYRGAIPDERPQAKPMNQLHENRYRPCCSVVLGAITLERKDLESVDGITPLNIILVGCDSAFNRAPAFFDFSEAKCIGSTSSFRKGGAKHRGRPP